MTAAATTTTTMTHRLVSSLLSVTSRRFHHARRASSHSMSRGEGGGSTTSVLSSPSLSSSSSHPFSSSSPFRQSGIIRSVGSATQAVLSRNPKDADNETPSAPDAADADADADADASPPTRPVLSPSSLQKVDNVFRRILQLDVVEVHLITELINEKLGRSMTAADRARMARGGEDGAGAGDTAAAAASKEEHVKEEKRVFDLKLVGFDAKAKIKVIKEVRTITGLGLKEAKEMVEGAPRVLKKDVKKEEAEALQKKLQDVGATVEIA